MKDKVEYTKEYFKDKLQNDRVWTERALVVLFERQTEDEQTTHSAKHENNAGFNKFDADFLSDLAKQIINGRHLSDRQLYYAQKRVAKYAGQILNIALAKKELEDEG